MIISHSHERLDILYGIADYTSFHNSSRSAIVICSPERFKIRAAHFPTQRNERTGMQRTTLGKSSSKTASQLQGRTARAFSSNSLVKTMQMTVVIQYILTATQSFGSQDY